MLHIKSRCWEWRSHRHQTLNAPFPGFHAFHFSEQRKTFESAILRLLIIHPSLCCTTCLDINSATFSSHNLKYIFFYRYLLPQSVFSRIINTPLRWGCLVPDTFLAWFFVCARVSLHMRTCVCIAGCVNPSIQGSISIFFCLLTHLPDKRTIFRKDQGRR